MAPAQKVACEHVGAHGAHVGSSGRTRRVRENEQCSTQTLQSTFVRGTFLQLLHAHGSC